VRPAAAQGPYKVSHVTDGGTIDVLIGRTSTMIRLLGIDTPETKKPNTTVQCYGPEASARTTQLLSDQSVWLETDPTQDKLDKYGRTARPLFRCIPDPKSVHECGGGRVWGFVEVADHDSRSNRTERCTLEDFGYLGGHRCCGVTDDLAGNFAPESDLPLVLP